MSKPFALWITRASVFRIRDSRLFVEGSAVGRAPEPGDALTIRAPLSPPLRVHCREVVGAARGGSGALFSLGLDEVRGVDPRQIVGGVLVEEGVAFRAYTALVDPPIRSMIAACHFDLGTDRAWGLVDIHKNRLNAVVVGGGLGGSNFWTALKEVRLGIDRIVIARPRLTAIVDVESESPALWQLPTVRTYERSSEEQALVVRSAGPVTRGSTVVFVDGEWREAGVFQQREGLTQFLLTSAPGMDTSVVTVPMSEAA